METDQMSSTTPEAAQVLVQMYQLLWQARGEAYQRFQADPKDFVSAELTFILYDLYGRVFDLIPPDFRDDLLGRPEITGADPVELARQAELLSRTQSVHHFPPGIATVVVRLIDTVREFS